MSCRTLPWCLHFSPFVGGREGVCCRPHCRADKDAPEAPRRPQERAAPQQQQQARHPHHQRARVEGHGQWQGGRDRDRRGGQRQGRGGEEGRDLQFLRWDASGNGVFLPLGGFMLSRFGSCKVLVTSLSWLVTDTVRNPGAELCGCDSYCSLLAHTQPSPVVLICLGYLQVDHPVYFHSLGHFPFSSFHKGMMKFSSLSWILLTLCG